MNNVKSISFRTVVSRTNCDTRGCVRRVSETPHVATVVIGCIEEHTSLLICPRTLEFEYVNVSRTRIIEVNIGVWGICTYTKTTSFIETCEFRVIVVINFMYKRQWTSCDTVQDISDDISRTSTSCCQEFDTC